MFDLTVIGGGAAGFFGAIHGEGQVLLLEKTASLLFKVKISGGGRCNVTHACFEPKELVKNYPRGGQALLGPFHTFGPQETIHWFESRGVLLKTEADGRMFPQTDSSQTIIDTLKGEALKRGVEIRVRQNIATVEKRGEEFVIHFEDGTEVRSKKLLLTTGSSVKGYEFAKSFGHTIVDPVPSLFTFNVPTSTLKELSGISHPEVEVRVDSLKQVGPLLITHFGFSGPAILKLSAFGARFLHEKNYQTELQITWVKQATLKLEKLKKENPNAILSTLNPFHFSKNLWKRFLELTDIPPKPLLHIPKATLEKLGQKLEKDIYQIEGKTTHKEEFVTAGGVNLDEVNFKRMESKFTKNLFFAGEILDIDGITGGFNFQSAWTTGWMAGRS